MKGGPALTRNRAVRIVAMMLFLVAAVAVVGAAWACVPQPLVTVRPASSGPAGTEVTVEGLAVNGALEIRWNSVDGPRLATATGPSFSVQVTIPEAPPGLYSVIVLERKPDASLASTGRAAFLVTGADPMPSGKPVPPPRNAARPAVVWDSSVSPALVVLAVMGGAALLALGAVGGALLTRRRHARERGG